LVVAALGKEGNDMDRIEAGRNVMRELMGEEFMERRDKNRNSFNATIQDYSDEVCFGMVWSRPGIDRKLRSILNIAMLVALNRVPQLRTHVEGAINNGCTPDELREILLHCAVYAGLPSAVEGFKVAEEVLKAKGLLE
jgi:4-carboxymuconolactone decarboxylase